MLNPLVTIRLIIYFSVLAIIKSGYMIGKSTKLYHRSIFLDSNHIKPHVLMLKDIMLWILRRRRFMDIPYFVSSTLKNYNNFKCRTVQLHDCSFLWYQHFWWNTNTHAHFISNATVFNKRSPRLRIRSSCPNNFYRKKKTKGVPNFMAYKLMIVCRGFTDFITLH